MSESGKASAANEPVSAGESSDQELSRPANRRRILVLTTEPLPVPGSATTGAGLRAWGLAKGLASRGFDVAVGSPALDAQASADAASGAGASSVPAADVRALSFRRPDGIARLLAAENPDVVVLQHWGLAAEVPELSVPLAIDLAGPHLLERLYWGDADPDRSLLEKLAALRRADFLVCSGERQRLYFLPFLLQTGWDVRRPDALPVIPFGVPPTPWATGDAEKPPAPGQTDAEAPPDPTFVYGGAFLAWQDPTGPIAWLLEELDRAGRGRLLFYGGSHPVIDASGGRFAALAETLSRHPRVEMRPFRPFDRLLEEYAREGTVALDLMARNPERELAYTTRTVVYLHCGLPVIYNDYSELSDVIGRHGCGWTLDPGNEAGFRTAVRSVLDSSAPLGKMRAGARAAAAEHSWERTIGPLAEFCGAPRLREGKTAALLSHESGVRELRAARAERDVATSELLQMKGKLLFRLHRRLPALAAPLAPLAWAAALPAALYLYFRLRPTTFQRRR